MTSEKDPYQKLLSLSKQAAIYTSISHLLEWDQETKMPKEAIALRMEQLEALAGLSHRQRTSPEYRDALNSLIDLETGNIPSSDLSDQQRAALRQWRRDYLQIAKLPTAFVEEFAKVTSAAIHVWQEAKKKNDFPSFEPHLEKIVTLNRKKADILGFDNHPYDALVDHFEQEMTSAELTLLFERLKSPLTKLLEKAQAKKRFNDTFLYETYPQDKQIAFTKELLRDMGLKESFSRLDESAHPMCVPIHPKDMRMTTKVYSNNVIINILSCIHEGGHALYHTHLPEEHFGTPLCDSASLGIDESQSRTWETFIGQSLPFWQFYFPKLQRVFPEQLGKVSLDSFYKALNIIEPSMIRVDSDEVSYNLHIMLRFELEKALIERSLKPREIPDAWNAKMEQYFGITPKTHSEGCLQDIHWSLGAIGYFPTYTLGNLYAGQFFETFSLEHPNWEERLAQGDLPFIAAWQKEKIHRFGRQFFPKDLCEKVTGKPLSEKPYLQYLETKYRALYHF